MKSKLISLIIGVVLLGMTGTTQATLIDLDYDLVFDDVNNITWYDFAYDPGFDDWPDTENWVNNLTYLDFTDWRLPTLDELLFLGTELRETGTYSTNPFLNVGSGLEFYLTSTLYGIDQRWAYSLQQDRLFGTWPVASIYGVAVRDGESSAPIPEPATALLIGIGIVGLTGTRLMKKAKISKYE